MKGNTRSKYLSPLPTWFPVLVHECLSKNRRNCLSINFASWKRWHPISGRIQPQPHALSQSYRFLMVSLCSSWSWGVGLKWASGQRAGTWDNQDGFLSQNHHRCHGDLILKEDVIILILSTGWDSICLPLRKKCGQVSVSMQQTSIFQGASTKINKQSKNCPMKADVQKLVSVTAQAYCPDSEQVLVLRKKTGVHLKH